MEDETNTSPKPVPIIVLADILIAEAKAQSYSAQARLIEARKLFLSFEKFTMLHLRASNPLATIDMKVEKARTYVSLNLKKRGESDAYVSFVESSCNMIEKLAGADGKDTWKSLRDSFTSMADKAGQEILALLDAG